MIISKPMIEALECMEHAVLAESTVTNYTDRTVYHQTAKNLLRAGLAQVVGVEGTRRQYAVTNDGLTVLRVVRRMRERGQA